jgi:hypothetical protein
LQGCSQNLYVIDEIPGGIVLQAGMRPALATTTLIEKDDSIHVGIEESSHLFRATAAGTAMQEYGGLAVWVAGLLIVELVTTADLQVAGMVGFDGWIQDPPFRVVIHGRHYERVFAGKPRVLRPNVEPWALIAVFRFRKLLLNFRIPQIASRRPSDDWFHY